MAEPTPERPRLLEHELLILRADRDAKIAEIYAARDAASASIKADSKIAIASILAAGNKPTSVRDGASNGAIALTAAILLPIIIVLWKWALGW